MIEPLQKQKLRIQRYVYHNFGHIVDFIKHAQLLLRISQRWPT